MSSIISEQTIAKIEGVRKYVQRVAIWTLIGSVVLGGILIFALGTSNMEIIGRFLGTIWILAIALLISMNNFKRVADKISNVQVFALIGLVSNIVWAILWILIDWIPELREVSFVGFGVRYSVFMKIAIVFSCLSFLGLVCSNVLALYEGDKKNAIKPLKITAVVLTIYEVAYSIIMTLANYNFRSEMSTRFAMLAGFLAFAWFVIIIVLALISKTEKNRAGVKKKEAEQANLSQAAPVAPKTEEELRAEIEEKVRREMIEKEVREKMGAEAQIGTDNTNNQSNPPVDNL